MVGQAGLVFCTECGAVVADGAKFCRSCGRPVAADAPVVEGASVIDGTPSAPDDSPPPPVATQSPRRRRWPWAMAGILALLAIIGAVAEGGKKSSKLQPTNTHFAAPTATTKAYPAVSLHLNAGSYSTTNPTTTLSGNATAGALVTVNGIQAQLHGGSWIKTVGLNHGETKVEVRATMAGHIPAEEIITVTRAPSAAEREAEATRNREKAENERRAYEEAATSIPYKELIKNPEAYDGRVVTYTGQIFQIQEAAGGGGWMLVSVDNIGGEAGVWTDHIYVNYTGHVKGTDGSIVSFYGKVTGAKSYKTQAGGETYVPEVVARYVVG